MPQTKRFGVSAGAQVPLDVANKHASLASAAIGDLEHAAADAAAQAVARVLKGAGGGSGRSTKTARATSKRKKD
jgi:hypothetical protein